MAVNGLPVAMIPGGNSGIGFATARELAAKGFHVILASRTLESVPKSVNFIGVRQSRSLKSSN